MSNFDLPPKIINGLRRLRLHYEASGEALLAELLGTARSYVAEGVTASGWNGDAYGHRLTLFLSEAIIRRISIDRQSDLCSQVKSDLQRSMGSATNEYLDDVEIELESPGDQRFEASVVAAGPVAIDPDTTGIWKSGHIRLFLSHRDTHKRAAKELAEALEDYGISTFVAHDTIAPMEEWQGVITSALITMQVMLAYITDDFHESVWTNQEVGFALGRDVPVVALKVGATDPRGFIGHRQALVQRDGSPEKVAERLMGILAADQAYAEAIRQSLISAFLASGDYGETRQRFDRLRGTVKRLSEEEVSHIASVYSKNSHLHNAIYLNNNYHRLQTYLSNALGRPVRIDGRTIRFETISIESADQDEIPF